MVKTSEDPLAQAEGFVRENERRIARQAALVARLESDGHAVPAMRAQELLVTFRGALEIAREHLHRERGKHGLPPS